jgi:hypothetical protein
MLSSLSPLDGSQSLKVVQGILKFNSVNVKLIWFIMNDKINFTFVILNENIVPNADSIRHSKH